jgi:hypothetical protein
MHDSIIKGITPEHLVINDFLKGPQDNKYKPEHPFGSMPFIRNNKKEIIELWRAGSNLGKLVMLYGGGQYKYKSLLIEWLGKEAKDKLTIHKYTKKDSVPDKPEDSLTVNEIVERYDLPPRKVRDCFNRFNYKTLVVYKKSCYLNENEIDKLLTDISKMRKYKGRKK